jgi:hypothetical protein
MWSFGFGSTMPRRTFDTRRASIRTQRRLQRRAVIVTHRCLGIGGGGAGEGGGGGPPSSARRSTVVSLQADCRTYARSGSPLRRDGTVPAANDPAARLTPVGPNPDLNELVRRRPRASHGIGWVTAFQLAIEHTGPERQATSAPRAPRKRPTLLTTVLRARGARSSDDFPFRAWNEERLSPSWPSATACGYATVRPAIPARDWKNAHCLDEEAVHRSPSSAFNGPREFHFPSTRHRPLDVAK